jgi:hypothetical protein
MTHVCNALTAAKIDHVGIFSYGQKSNAQFYTFLDLLPPDTFISLDIGFHLYTAQYHDTVPTLSYHGPSRYQQGITTSFPMFSNISQQNGQTHGGLLWAHDNNPDIQSLKLYPLYTHILKANTASNFMTLPSNTLQSRQRVNQIRQFHLFLESSLHSSDPRNIFQYIPELRAETRTTYHKSLLHTIQHSKVFAADYLKMCAVHNISLHIITHNLDEFINMTRLYNIGRGTNTAKLSMDNRAIMATVLNQAGVATQRVVEFMQLKDIHNRYKFQRSLTKKPRLRRAPGTLPAVHSDPVVTPVTPGVNIDEAVEAAIAMMPRPPSDLQEIRRHLNVSFGPNGKLAIRDIRGRLFKLFETEIELYLYVQAHVPEWYHELSVR